MTAETFESDLVAAFPEVAAELRALQDSWGEGKPGIHIVVGDVLAPHVVQTLDADDRARVQSVCTFDFVLPAFG